MKQGPGLGRAAAYFLYALGIIFFAYFYVSIVFNPKDVSDNMQKYGGFIPGIRPGARTAITSTTF
jgi:preprotein translocase subunit SecY